MSVQDSISSYKNFSKAVPPQLSQQVLTALHEARVSTSSNEPSASSSPSPSRQSLPDAGNQSVQNISKTPRPTPFNRLLDEYAEETDVHGLTKHPTSQNINTSSSSCAQQPSEKFGYAYDYDYSPFRSQSSTHSSHPVTSASRPPNSSVTPTDGRAPRKIRLALPVSPAEALPSITRDNSSVTSVVEQSTNFSNASHQTRYPSEQKNPKSSRPANTIGLSSENPTESYVEKLKPSIQSEKSSSKSWSINSRDKIKSTGIAHQHENSIPFELYEQAESQRQPGYTGPFDPRICDGMTRHNLRSVLGDYHRGQEIKLLYKEISKTPPRRTSFPAPYTSPGAAHSKDNSHGGFIKVSFVRPQFSLNPDAHNRAAKFIPCSSSQDYKYKDQGLTVSMMNGAGEEKKTGERAFSFIGSGLNGAKGDAESILGKLRSVTMRVPCDLADGRYIMASTWVGQISRDGNGPVAYSLIQICGGLPLEQPENPPFSRFDERYTYAWQPEDSEQLRKGLEQGGEGDRAMSALSGGEWDYSEYGLGDGQDGATNVGDMQPAKHKWDVKEEPQRPKLRGMVKGVMKRMGLMRRREGEVDKSESVGSGRFLSGRSMSMMEAVPMMDLKQQ